MTDPLLKKYIGRASLAPVDVRYLQTRSGVYGIMENIQCTVVCRRNTFRVRYIPVDGGWLRRSGAFPGE